MMKQIPLGNVVQINPSSIGKAFPFDKIDYIDISSVGTGTSSGTTRMKLEDAPSRAKRLVAHGDTILATVRPNLRSFLYIKNPTPNTVASTGFAVLRATDKIDQRYLYYSVTSQSFTDYLSANVKGAAYPAVDTEAIARGTINLPALTTQQKIASILSAYDDLLENNLKRIKVLEEMAQMIYREWFVNFRFPGHEKVKMVESELGMIPEGWEVIEFRNIFTIKYGKTLPKSKIAEIGSYPVYGAGDVIGYYDEVLCHDKCVLVTSRGNGSGTVWRTREAAFVTNNSLMIQPNAKFGHFNYPFIELLLKHSNVMAAKTGSAQPQVTIENLNYVKAIVPVRKTVEKFCSLVNPIYEQVDLYFKKCANLRKTRDLLLPKLISGEIDVENVNINMNGASV